jgi:cytochrome c-type biogenesis protein CcmH/NrfG
MDEDILRQILVEVRETNQFNRKMHRFYSIFVVVMVALAITTPFLMRGGSLTKHKSDFTTQARRLLDENKPSEVIPLADNYMKQEPLSPQGPWYMALAQYQLDNFQDALHWFDKTQELAPYWENDYIKPYRTAIDKKLSKSTTYQAK